MKTIREIKRYFDFIQGNVLILTLSEIIVHITNSIAKPYLSLYILALGGSSTTIGQINAAASLTRALTRLPGGYIADKWGRKKVIDFMTLSTGLVYILYIIAVDWKWILLGSIFQAITAIYVPAYRAMEADSIPPDKRGKGYMIIHLLPQMSLFISPLFGAILIDRFKLDIGIRIGYAIALFGSLCATYMRAKFSKETLSRTRFIRTDLSNYLRLVSPIKYVAIYKAIFMATTMMLDPFFIVYATTIGGISVKEWGIIVSVSIATSVALSYPIGHLSDRYGRKKLLLLMFTMFALGILIFSSSKIFIILFISYLLIYLARTSSRAILMAIEADIVQKDVRGRMFAIIDVITFSIGFPLSLLSGVAYEHVSQNSIFIVGAFLVATSAIILILFYTDPRIRES